VLLTAGSPRLTGRHAAASAWAFAGIAGAICAAGRAFRTAAPARAAGSGHSGAQAESHLCFAGLACRALGCRAFRDNLRLTFGGDSGLGGRGKEARQQKGDWRQNSDNAFHSFPLIVGFEMMVGHGRASLARRNSGLDVQKRCRFST